MDAFVPEEVQRTRRARMNMDTNCARGGIDVFIVLSPLKEVDQEESQERVHCEPCFPTAGAVGNLSSQELHITTSNMCATLQESGPFRELSIRDRIYYQKRFFTPNDNPDRFFRCVPPGAAGVTLMEEVTIRVFGSFDIECEQEMITGR